MSEEITEHVSYDRGYNKGFVSGLKRAFELVGQLGDFYEDGVKFQKMQQMKKNDFTKIQEEIK